MKHNKAAGVCFATGSIPVPGTPESSNNQLKTNKLQVTLKADKSTRVYSECNFLLSIILSDRSAENKPFPFQECKLWIPAADSKYQKWVIAFKVWDRQQRRLVLKKEADFNKNFKPGEEKKKRTWCKQRMIEINNLLKAGFIIDRQAEEQEMAPQTVSLEKMMDVALLKVKTTGERNIETQKVIKERFCSYLESVNLLKSSAQHFSSQDAEEYLAHLQLKEKKAMRTIDNYKNGLKTLFKLAIKEKIIQANPWVGIKNKNRSLGKNIAYNPEQQKELIEFMSANEPQLLLRCLFMYNTFFRTKEMSWLKISYVRHNSTNKIYLPAEHAKNGTGRHVNITNELQEVLEQLQLDRYPKEYYIFSWKFKPGPVRMNENEFGSIYREKVLDKLGYHKDYTFYSWKHTGVVNAISAGVPTVAVFKQGGWKSWVSFEKYLKSLGLMENEEFEQQHPPLMPKLRIA